MKLVRRLHLYLGCFFTPLLLFYVLTGWYQTFNPNRTKAAGEAVGWIARLRSVHVDQIYPSESVQAYSPRMFRWLVAVMGVALALTVLLGVYLAFKALRPRWLAAASLALGVAVPILLLLLGQRR